MTHHKHCFRHAAFERPLMFAIVGNLAVHYAEPRQMCTCSDIQRLQDPEEPLKSACDGSSNLLQSAPHATKHERLDVTPGRLLLLVDSRAPEDSRRSLACHLQVGKREQRGLFSGQSIWCMILAHPTSELPKVSRVHASRIRDKRAAESSACLRQTHPTNLLSMFHELCEMPLRRAIR
jgi:hypothetical protein